MLYTVEIKAKISCLKTAGDKAFITVFENQDQQGKHLIDFKGPAVFQKPYNNLTSPQKKGTVTYIYFGNTGNAVNL